ncbi:DUF559 domain-containing protein [Rothia aerolata]|nr:DUF559 domain-containing protein [Rothia aerolata]
MSRTYRKIDEISSLIHRKKDLLSRGFSSKAIQKNVRTGSAVRLRQGIYINAQEIENFSPWERYSADLFAYHLCASNLGHPPVFSHQSAALLHGLWLVGKPPTKQHVYSPGSSRGTTQGVSKHATGTPFHLEIPTLGIQATDVYRTVLDCTRTLPFLEALPIADSALHLQKCLPAELCTYLSDFQGTHSKKVHRIARAMSAKAESPGESLTRAVLINMGVKFIEQYPVYVGYRGYRVDFYLPDYNIIIEFDGDIKYSQFGNQTDVEQNERYREKVLQNAGFLVYRTSWNKVLFSPAQVEAEIWNLIKNAPRRMG